MIPKFKQTGFSLIELLVVVAIIGVLALAGTYGYMKYMDSTRESLMDTSRKEFLKLIETEMARPSAPKNGVAYVDCFELIDAAINASNKESTNLYNQHLPVWFNAHRELKLATGSVVSWGQGEHLVICDDPNKTLGEGNNIAVCSCTDKICKTSASASYSPTNTNACPNPIVHN